MVELSVHDGRLRLDVLGAHKLWALKSELEVPLSSVVAITARPDLKLGWWHGARLPGTHLPGVLVAGSYLKKGEWSFWDVRHPQNALEITLDGERYRKLFVEVADPEDALRRLEEALSS